MDLGTSAAVFLILAVVLMSLFCLVTKYFNYKLKKALEGTDQVYSMIDEIGKDNSGDVEGEYDEFALKRKKKAARANYQEDPAIEMKEIKEPLNAPNDVYGISMLRRRLNGEVIPIKIESSRSMSSLRSFRPDKMSTRRSDRSGTDKEDLKKEEISSHSYIDRVVAYEESGITILEVKLDNVKKTEAGGIEEKKSTKRVEIERGSEGFEDQLQNEGFEKNEYGALKFQTTLQIVGMKVGEDYNVQTLKSSRSKTPISFAEYYKLREQLV